MASKGISMVLTNLMLKCFILLFISDFISCLSYPLFGNRRYARTVPIGRSAYFPLSFVHHRAEYQLPDYDDEFIVNPQEEYEYNAYEKYPYVQFFGYFPNKDYYRDKAARRSLDGFEYFDDRIPQDSGDEISDDLEKESVYPYGQETWYEEELPKYDRNAETNVAFLQNLILAQMYQDAKNHHPFGYESTADDYDDQHWLYGVPTTEVGEKEKVKEYFKNKEDEEVRELESLSRKKNKIKKLKGKELFKKQNNLEIIEKPTKPKSKMTDDEYFDLQKQIVINSRKNNFAPVAEGLKLSKKQTYNPVDVKNNFWDFYNGRTWPSYLESATNSIKKLNVNKSIKGTTELGVSDSKIKVETSSTAAVSSTPASKKPPSAGQKEVVLMRPSNSIRRPFPEISSRNLHQPSVYDTIKKLLNMDKNLQKSEISQLQKRFVLNEDQLTAQLNGLKKSPAEKKTKNKN